MFSYTNTTTSVSTPPPPIGCMHTCKHTSIHMYHDIVLSLAAALINTLLYTTHTHTCRPNCTIEDVPASYLVYR